MIKKSSLKERGGGGGRGSSVVPNIDSKGDLLRVWDKGTKFKKKKERENQKVKKR